MAEVTKEAPPVLPKWFTEGITDRFKAQISSVFILHGDLMCLTPNPMGDEEPNQAYLPLEELLKRVFARGGREMVVVYNIATGPRFFGNDEEVIKKFRLVSGMDKEKPDEAKSKDAPKDPFAKPDDDGEDAIASARASLDERRPIPQEPELFFPLMEKVLSKMDGVAFIIESAHTIYPNGDEVTLSPNALVQIERMRTWAQDRRVKRRDNIVILQTDVASRISNELRKPATRIATVCIPKPNAEERRRYVEWLINGPAERQEVARGIAELQAEVEEAKGAKKESLEEQIENLEKKLKKFPPVFSVPKDFDINLLVNATQGMGLRQVLEIFRYSAQTERPIDLFLVRDKKREILNLEYGTVMEIVDPERGLEDIGGLEHIKKYFGWVIDIIRDGKIDKVPMGVTLMGPPGTAKTALGEALAKECGFNFVKMKNARGKYVGETEANTELQIAGLRALAPVFCLNDEADLKDADRDSPKGDSGVSERAMQAWMTLLSDPTIRGRIMMINCTNRPDRIDPALMRSGRSDVRIALIMPNASERALIYPIMFKRHKIKTSITDFTQAANAIAVSGADIEVIVMASDKFAERAGKKEVDMDSLMEAVNDFIPSASQKEIDLMTLLAIGACSSRELLPVNVLEAVTAIRDRDLLPNTAEMISQLEERKIVKLSKPTMPVAPGMN